MYGPRIAQPDRSNNRHVEGRRDPREGAKVPCGAPEERAEEKEFRKWAWDATKHANTGEQAADASSGAARLQVSAIPNDLP